MCKSTPVIKYPIAPWRLQRAAKGWRSLEPEVDTFRGSCRRKGVDENTLRIPYANPLSHIINIDDKNSWNSKLSHVLTIEKWHFFLFFYTLFYSVFLFK